MIKLGILQCDKVSPALLPQYGDYPLMFMRLFANANLQFTYQVYDVTSSQLPKEVNDCDAYLITGSRHSVNDDYPWIAKLIAFIQKAHQQDKKMIGICFGHQVIVKALGGVVATSARGWGIGMSTNQVVLPKPWMTKETSSFNLLVSHQQQVVALPQQAVVLAKSDFCPFYMLQIDSFFTVQGHPEFSKGYTKALITSRKHLYTSSCYQQGLDSLHLAEDNLLFASWIGQFLQ